MILIWQIISQDFGVLAERVRLAIRSRPRGRDIILYHLCANHRLPNITTLAQLIFTKVVPTLFCTMFAQLIGQSTRKLGCGARLRCVDASLVDALARMRQRPRRGQRRRGRQESFVVAS